MAWCRSLQPRYRLDGVGICSIVDVLCLYVVNVPELVVIVVRISDPGGSSNAASVTLRRKAWRVRQNLLGPCQGRRRDIFSTPQS